jgi:hypothetical protein
LRRVAIEFVGPDEIDAAWGASKARRLFARHFTSGRPYLTVDYDESRGYRIWASRHGRHLVSENGARVMSAPPRRAGWWWQRLMLAQVLPIAASLQGIDVLHASAVVVDGKAAAITAEPGTGKTTLAVHLVDRGAELLADDVVALEVVGAEILAHPGVSLLNLDPAQLVQLGPRARQRLATDVGKGDKLYLLAELADAPSPLAAIYFLRRDSTRSELVVERQSDARTLLGTSFVPYLDQPHYLFTHLDVCSRIVETVPLFTIAAPTSMSAADLAAAVASHLEKQ